MKESTDSVFVFTENRTNEERLFMSHLLELPGHYQSSHDKAITPNEAQRKI